MTWEQALTPTLEQTLNMILKVVFTILDFVKNALEDSNEDE